MVVTPTRRAARTATLLPIQLTQVPLQRRQQATGHALLLRRWGAAFVAVEPFDVRAGVLHPRLFHVVDPVLRSLLSHVPNLTAACGIVGVVGAEYLTVAQVAEIVKVKPATIRAYLAHRLPRANPFPEPDYHFAGRAGWLRTTVDEWLARRPGRGARTDLASNRPA